jgi:hypothetical protein
MIAEAGIANKLAFASPERGSRAGESERARIKSYLCVVAGA